MISDKILKEFDIIDAIAQENTTCLKTYVGCSLGYEYEDGSYLRIATGVNSNKEHRCKFIGVCYRKQQFGSDSKEFRKFCKAKHAEEVAIEKLVASDEPNVAIVTRYPCDNCARLLCENIPTLEKVYYGREFEISDYAKQLFIRYGIEVIHVTDWECSDKNDSNR